MEWLMNSDKQIRHGNRIFCSAKWFFLSPLFPMRLQIAAATTKEKQR